MKEETVIVIMVVVFCVIMFWLLFDMFFEGKIYKAICKISDARNLAPNKMKFSSFVAFYELNPDKWELFKGYVVYETEDKDLIDEWREQVKNGNVWGLLKPTKIYKFSFSYKDLWRYRRFRKHIFKMQEIEEKYKEDKRNYEQYQEALEYLKQDLEEFKKQRPWEDIKL